MPFACPLEHATELNRLQKTLEAANIKLASVATDILGATGRAILEALAAGKSQGPDLAWLAKGSLRRKRAELERALVPEVSEHQRLLIREHLAHINYLRRRGRGRSISDAFGTLRGESDVESWPRKG